MNISLKNKNKDLQKNDDSNKNNSLIERMRPKEFSQYIGQNHVIKPETLLYNLLKIGVIPSMILWGPSGCGKRSLINVIIEENKKLSKCPLNLIELSAAVANINDIKTVVNEAQTLTKQSIKTIVLINEIHKFNKLQQDIFLPHIEVGTFTLIGTTIENPSSSLNSALLSRCRIFGLKRLEKADLIFILFKAIELMNEEKINFFIPEEVIEWLAEVCDGDGRIALNGLEMAVNTKLSNSDKNLKTIHLSSDDIKCCLMTIQVSDDKQSDNIYHMHSALHHCIIMDDDNAALYWLARIMATGEDPTYIAKRLVKIASEDIDIDDEDALSVAVHTMQACQMIGMPESDVLLAQCVVYLTRAEKSKEVLDALIKSKNVIENHVGPQLEIPSFLQDKSKQEIVEVILGSDANAAYEQNVNKNHLPEALQNVNFFEN